MTSSNTNKNLEKSSLKLVFLSTPSEVSYIVGDLTRDGYDDISNQFKIQLDSTVCYFNNIPVGNWELTEMAYSKDGTQMFNGFTPVCINPNVVNLLNLVVNTKTGLIEAVIGSEERNSPFLFYSRLSKSDWHNHQGVYKLDLNNNNEVLFTNEGFYGSISHNNQYYYYRQSNYATPVWRKGIHSILAEQVTQEPGVNNWPRISNLENYILCNDGNAVNHQVYIMNIDGSNKEAVGNCIGYSVFSPDDEYILNQGVLYTFDGQVQERLIKIDDADWDVFSNEYSSDGQYIVALAQSPPYAVIGPDNRENTRIYLYNVSSGDLNNVTPNLASEYFINSIDFVQFNDGPRVIFSTRDIIGIMNIDGSDVKILKQAALEDDYFFAWLSGSH